MGVMAVDWRTRAFALADLAERRREIQGLIPAIRTRVLELNRRGEHLAAAGGRRELTRLAAERKDIERLLARRGEAIQDPNDLWHVALIPTYTEPFEKLYETVAALARTDYPRHLLMVAIITRETDLEGREKAVPAEEYV